MTERRRRVATYERVSSEDQRDRQTIKTQTEQLARRLEADATVTLVARYVDDGVSGMIPMAERPDGSRLLADAARGDFDELWIYSINRLGRDDVDPLVVWRELDRLGVVVQSIVEGRVGAFTFHIHVAVAAEERRAFLARSAAGLDRAASEGRYTGGICPYGYRVEGARGAARLVPDETIVWADWTAADVIRRIIHWVAEDGWSARRVADELNSRGVPTAYAKEGRGVRGKKTEARWWPGRILQLVKNATYKGEMRYGKRSTKPGREVITARIPRLVSDELWNAAQAALETRRRVPVAQRHPYLLRSLISCGRCHLNYTGSCARGGKVWYRCNGQLVGRGPQRGRCLGKGIDGTTLETALWADIERFLRDPGSLLGELAREMADGAESRAAETEAERTTLEAALRGLFEQRDRVLDLYVDDRFDRNELGTRLDTIEDKQHEIEARLNDLSTAIDDVTDAAIDADVLAQLRTRLDAGLSAVERQEIAALLVKRITIHTTIETPRKKRANAVVEYRFPVVVATNTVRGSSRRSS